MSAQANVAQANDFVEENSKPDEFQSFDELVVNHRENGRKLSRSILRRWRVRMAPDEIDSIVDLALCEAAHRYDATKGASFMTFFYYHLRGHLVRAVASAANASNIFLAYAQNNGMEIGDWSRTSEESISYFLPDNSLFGRSEEETPEALFLKKEKAERCADAISQLDELEQAVLNRSFRGGEQLIDIASQLGYSRCHISRVKKRALERLQTLLESSEGQTENGQPSRVTARERKLPRRRRRRRTLPQSAMLPERKRA